MMCLLFFLPQNAYTIPIRLTFDIFLCKIEMPIDHFQFMMYHFHVIFNWAHTGCHVNISAREWPKRGINANTVFKSKWLRMEANFRSHQSVYLLYIIRIFVTPFIGKIILKMNQSSSVFNNKVEMVREFLDRANGSNDDELFMFSEKRVILCACACLHYVFLLYQ